MRPDGAARDNGIHDRAAIVERHGYRSGTYVLMDQIAPGQEA